MKKIISLIPVFLAVALFAVLIILGITNHEFRTVTYSNKAVVDVDISEVIDPEWFDYSYFWTSGRDENGKDLTIVTIYWAKTNEEGVTTYVTDGKKWEEMK